MELDESTVPEPALEVSIVVPVYQGEQTLALLAEETEVDLGEVDSFRSQVRAAFEHEGVAIFWWRVPQPLRA